MKKIDNTASEMIPIRLIISIAIMAAIAFMLAVGYNNLSITLSENQIENQYITLESKLYTMLASGVTRDVDELNAGDGTMRTHTFDLPDNVVYLAFGIDPDPNNNGELITGLTDDGSAVFYKVSNGNKHVIWLSGDDFRFREGNNTNGKWIINNDEQGFILRNSGKTTLTFELVQKNHEKYVLILANDNINP
jgi:hypothetical protein